MLRSFGLAVLLVTSGCAPPTAPDDLRPTPAASVDHEFGTDAQHDRPTAPLEDATAVAAAFAQAWTRRSADRDTWWAENARWCDEGLAGSLLSTDPANVPASAVLGPPTIVGGSVEDGVRLDVPTDAGTLRLTLGALDGEWKVTEIDFIRNLR